MISKELLSEVLNEEIIKIYNLDSNLQYYKNYCIHNESKPTKNYINIYELAHKCKEWAYPYGYTILSSTDECYLIDREGIGLVSEQHYVHEAQAVFDACQWILENKEK